MKTLKLIIVMLISLASLSQTLTVLDKGDTLVAQNHLTVVMDKYTFGRYAYTVDKYDTLKQKYLIYDSVVKVQDSLNEIIISDYKILAIQKENEKDVYRTGYEAITTTLNQSIDRNNKLQIDYKKLEQKNRQVKRWRNIFMGSSVCFGTVILLIVVL